MKRKTWLWAIGWVLCFPLPLGALIWRNPKIKINVKIVIIALSVVIYFSLGILGSKRSFDKTTQSDKIEYGSGAGETSNISSTPETIDEEVTNKFTEEIANNDFQEFINKFNMSSDIRIISQEKIDIHDEKGGHYRVEFRLPAYDNAVGLNVAFSDQSSADLIDGDSFSLKTDNETIARIYVLAKSKESFQAIFTAACKAMHPDTVTEEDINDALEQIFKPIGYEQMEQIWNTGSGLLADKFGFTYAVEDKNNHYDFMLD